MARWLFLAVIFQFTSFFVIDALPPTSTLFKASDQSTSIKDTEASPSASSDALSDTTSTFSGLAASTSQAFGARAPESSNKGSSTLSNQNTLSLEAPQTTEFPGSTALDDENEFTTPPSRTKPSRASASSDTQTSSSPTAASLGKAPAETNKPSNDPSLPSAAAELNSDGKPSASPLAAPNLTPKLVMPVPGQCKKMCQRKEVLSMGPGEFEKFAKAFMTLSKTMDANGKSLLEILVDEHLGNQTKTHFNPIFLPWHRYYLARLEQSLQTIDPDVCLPYWDWSLRPEKFWEDEIFSEKYFGSATPHKELLPIPNGPFKGLRMSPNKPEVVRSFSHFNEQKQEIVLTGFMTCYDLLNQATTFEEFHQLFSGVPHIGPHEFTGGDMGTMGSSKEALFYAHHGMLDLLLSRFQNKTSTTPSENDFLQSSTLIPQYDLPVKNIMNTTDLCYSYVHNHDAIQPDFNQVKKPTVGSEDAFKTFLGSAATKVIQKGEKALDDAQERFKRKEAPRFKFLSNPNGKKKSSAQSSHRLGSDTLGFVLHTVMVAFTIAVSMFLF